MEGLSQGKKCGRDDCIRAAKVKGLCKYHYEYTYLKDSRKRASAKWEARNKEKRLTYTKNWQKRPENLEKIRRWRREGSRRIRSSAMGRLSHNFANYIRRGITHGMSWRKSIGYTLQDLKTHLESKFLPGMSWDNYGHWHIDHIIPISAFSYQSSEDPQFKECWALSNLQPLWAIDNLKKSNKYEKKTEKVKNQDS